MCGPLKRDCKLFCPIWTTTGSGAIWAACKVVKYGMNVRSILFQYWNKRKNFMPNQVHTCSVFSANFSKKSVFNRDNTIQICTGGKIYNMIPSFIMTPRLKQPGKYGFAFVMWIAWQRTDLCYAVTWSLRCRSALALNWVMLSSGEKIVGIPCYDCW